jgi:hypothetical protein
MKNTTLNEEDNEDSINKSSYSNNMIINGDEFDNQENF